MAYLAVPDTEDYCFKNQFSDCILVIEEEGYEQQPAAGSTAKKGKRKRENRSSVPAHSILLATSSSYFAAKLENWSDSATSSTNSGKPEVFMPVPPGQLSAGQLLVRIMYQQKPQITGASQQQLLQLLLLADRYHVPKAFSAVAAAFQDIPTDQLAWETALTMLQLPESCTVQESFQKIAAVAGNKITSLLGDLELVWEDAEQQQLLLSLPAAALEQLLKHDGTSVASENTVAYTVLRWFEAQEDLTAEAAASLGLLQLVRMRHCTQLYISSIVAQHELFRACFSPGEAALAAMCCTKRGYRALRNSHTSVLKEYPAWRAKQRPETFRLQMFEWKLQLSDLQDALRQVLATLKPHPLFSQNHILQGQQFRLCMVCVCGSRSSSDHQSSRVACISLALIASALSAGAACQVTFRVECEAITGGGPLPYPEYNAEAMLSSSSNTWIIPDQLFWQLGNFSQWEAVEGSLRNKGLVHADGCLHLRVLITELL